MCKHLIMITTFFNHFGLNYFMDSIDREISQLPTPLSELLVSELVGKTGDSFHLFKTTKKQYDVLSAKTLLGSRRYNSWFKPSKVHSLTSNIPVCTDGLVLKHKTCL